MDTTYSVRTSRWIEYWETRLQLNDGDTIHTDGRIRVTYASSKSGSESKMSAEVEKVAKSYRGKIKVYIDVSGRKPRYWMKGRADESVFDIEYDPENTHGDKVLGAVRDIKWIETPAERAAERAVELEDCDRVKVCERCEEENQPDAYRCDRCDGYINDVEPEEVTPDA